MSEELRHFVDKIKTDAKASGNSSVYVYTFFNLSLVNVIWSMVAGKTFSYDDERLIKFIEMNEGLFKAGNFGSDISVAFPFLRHMFPNATNANLFKAGFAEFHEYFRVRSLIKEHFKVLEFTKNIYCNCLRRSLQNIKQDRTTEQIRTVLWTFFSLKSTK